MHNQPSVSELIEAVKHFIDQTAAPSLTGHAAFHARVASNVLATVLRDLDARSENDLAEQARLADLLKPDPGTSLDALNATLCEQIRDRTIDLASAQLIDHLRQTTIAQVRVDQPGYSGLKAALDQRGNA